MRIEIDTVNKTIVVLSPVSYKELLEQLPKMVLNVNDYSICSKIEHNLPYTYQYPFTVNPATQPLSPPFYTTCGGDNNFGVQNGLTERISQPQ